MKSVDLSHIKKVSVDYPKMSANLAQKYKGQWDDPVHDSFAEYNNQIETASEAISKIYDSTKEIADSSLDNESLISRVDKVLGEVKTL